VAPFATLNEVAMVITDEGIDAEAIEQFRRSGTELVVVNEHGVSNYVRRQRDYFTIGFANLDNSGFAADVLASLEAAAEKQNIRLIVKNNQLNSELALKNADDLLDEGIDLMIEYHIDERIGGVIMDKFNRHRVPVICIDIPMIGATYFGVDNYNAGLMAGEALGEWIMEHWGGHYDRILILEEPRGGTLTASRIYGQIDGLQKILGKITDGKRIYLNSGNRIDVSKSSVMETLRAYPEFHRLAILPFNDDAAIGACRAARELNREKDIIIVGQGASPITRAELRNQDSRVMGSTAFWPEQYGEKVIDIAKRILDGQRVPNAVTMQHTFLTAKNINQFYPEG
jgi:ribose transport system substrate-binding protein